MRRLHRGATAQADHCCNISEKFVRGMGAYVNNCRVVEKNDAP
jgi:hypothetical protein